MITTLAGISCNEVVGVVAEESWTRYMVVLLLLDAFMMNGASSLELGLGTTTMEANLEGAELPS